jgi:hypothetical protein
MLIIVAPCAAPAQPGGDPHAANDVYQSLLHDGITLAATHVAFPAPLLTDSVTPDAERAILHKLAGSDSAVREFLRNAVTAPQILKLRDEKAADGTIIRVAELYFAVHARLEDIDPGRLGRREEDGKPVEAGNMKLSTRRMSDEALKERGIARQDPKLEWYTHTSGTLLDKIEVESTDRARSTQSAASWVFASRTDLRFDGDKQYPNRWKSVGLGAAKQSGSPNKFDGGASTTRISRLASSPETLFVECHFAFAEPRAWFDGAPILRSKISIVAQDQIRRLRREFAQRAARPAQR